MGTELLRWFTSFDLHLGEKRNDLPKIGEWSDKRYLEVAKRLKNSKFEIESPKKDFEELKSFLIGKRNFLLGLLENPNLLEHESFTELLWAVFHLTEETACRVDLKQLPDTDCQHLSGDIKRVYVLLITEWLAYMKHLRDNYPYLFSLAARMNPFNPNASPVVT